MPDDIKFSIDGQEVTARPGQTVLQAAMDSGIYIPYLCYYPGLKPYGACRACVVDVDSNGRKMTVASCTVPAAPDMEVTTNSDSVVGLRRGIMELLMSEHPHGCLTCHRIELCGPQDICQRHVAVTDRCTICPKNERCELKDTVRMLELDLRTPLNYHRRNLPVHTDDPFYDRDYNLCIVCARCVRVCEEVRFDNALTLTSRSGVALVGTAYGSSLLESGCEFCGACIDVCPTGALVERDYKWEKAKTSVTTICTNCPVGCQMIADVNRFGKVIRFRGDLSGESNYGQACFKGKFAYDYPNHKTRLKSAYVREGGIVKNIGVEDSLSRIATAFKRYSPDEIAVIASPRGSNEDNYLASKFARLALKTNNIDTGANFAPDLLRRMNARLGVYGATNPVWDLQNARSILVVAGNPTEEQNVLAVPIKKAARDGASIIVIDARETELTRYASEWIQVKPGTEHILLAGFARVVSDEALEDQEAVTIRTVELDVLKKSLWEYDPGKVALTCGVDETQLRRAARLYAENGPAAIVFGADTLPSQRHAALADAAINLALLCGNIGVASGGVYPLMTGASTVGSADVGCAPDILPGGRSVSVAGDRAAVEALWESPVPDAAAPGVAEQFELMRSGKIKAVILMADGMNPDAPQLGDVAAALGALEFLAVSAAFDSTLTASADVVIPAATYIEQTSTITNLERRVQQVRAGSEPADGVLAGWQVFAALGNLAGAAGFTFDGPAAVFDEVRKLVPAYSGIDYERLANGGIQSPCPTKDHPGTRVAGIVSDGSDRIAFEAMPFDETTSERASLESTLTLAPGRVLHQPERHVEVVKRDGMNYAKRAEFVRIHSADAVRLNVTAGDIVRVEADGRELVTALAKLDGPHEGFVSVTTLFAEIASAMQDSDHPDASPGVPALSLRAVTLSKVPAPEQAEVMAD